MLPLSRSNETTFEADVEPGRRADLNVSGPAGRQRRAAQDIIHAGRWGGAVRIGIWERTVIDGEELFQRFPRGEPIRLWADVGTIKAVPKGYRVVLLGESVARGFFYDPEMTPASVLQQLLQQCQKWAEAEVVDLARTDISLAALTDLASAAAALQPSAMVVMAGNNWTPYEGWDDSMSARIHSILAGGVVWPRVKQFYEDEMVRQTRQYLGRLSAASNTSGAQVVVVIPEFNLRDWRSSSWASVAFMEPTQACRWWTLYDSAHAACRAGDFNVAAEHASEMIVLDEGGAAASLELLAYAQQSLGRTECLRSLLEAARDADLPLPVLSSPRCFSVVQQTLRNEAPAYGFRVVDLPAVFQEYLDGDLPDRRLFLDYCHLTAEGIHVAMAAVAEELSASFEKEFCARVQPAVPTADRGVCARASLVAAIHNARWGQRYEIVKFHCLEALRLSAAMATAMRSMLDFEVRRAPTVVCHSFLPFLHASRIARRNLLLISGGFRRGKALRLSLIRALIDTLNDNTARLEQQFEDLLANEHAVDDQEVDLLETFHSSCCGVQQENSWRDRASYYKAYHRESVFQIVLARPQPVRFRLTARLPEVSADANVRLNINGQNAGAYLFGPSWSSRCKTAASDCFRTGVNEVALSWPHPAFPARLRIARLFERVRAGLHLEVLPVYGEIQAFTASAAGGVTERPQCQT